MRVGSGFDAHAFTTGRDLIVGGVKIPHDRGLHGHSDADVLCHAIGDALLGAAGLGDLGARFPATDEWMGASSLAILEAISVSLRDAGYGVVNVDATIIAQAPRMGPHVPAMREKIAAAIGVGMDRVSVKATSTDGMGYTGRGEGIAATAVASIEPLV